MRKMGYRQWIGGVAGEAETLGTTLEDAITLGSDGRALLFHFLVELNGELKKRLAKHFKPVEKEKAPNPRYSILAQRWGARLA